MSGATPKKHIKTQSTYVSNNSNDMQLLPRTPELHW